MNIRSGHAALLGCLIGSALEAQSGQVDRQKLDSIAGAGVLANRAVGLVAAVVRGTDTLLLKGYGKADVEWDVPMPADAMFEVGSIAKQFAAASILQLRDAGKLSLDDTITRWLPFLGLSGENVTLRRLLSHTAGIFPFAEEPDFEINFLAPRFPRDSAYKLIRLDPFKFPPGQAQAYSNSGFWLLGLVVEKASGMKYEDYLDQQIFGPLGMKRSMYCNSQANVPHRAHGYQLVNGALRRAPVPTYAWVFAPGAICSTAGDLVTWLKALHGGKVLSPKSYAEMTTRTTLADGITVQYGMGIKVGENFQGLSYIGHGGTAPGFRSDATWYPEGQLAVVVLMNTSPATIAPNGVSFALAATVLQPPRPEVRNYLGDATDLIGTYQWVAGGNQGPTTIHIATTDKGLAAMPDGGRQSLLAWAGGLHFYISENTSVTFVRANRTGGPVTGFRIDDAGNHRIFRKD